LQKKSISTLFALCLILSSVPALYNFVSEGEPQYTESRPTTILDFAALAVIYGDQIPIVAKFDNGLSKDLINLISELNLEFTLGSERNSHVGPYYLLEGSSDSLEALVEMGVVADIAPQTTARFLESPRDISIPEINADDVWNALDDFGRNVTGEGILIADLDSGVDWRHPDLWFADGGSYPYVNGTSTGFVNGTDGVDFNRDFALDVNESLYALDLDRNGIFDVRTEWLWADNLIQNQIPDVGELFFVVNDTSDNGLLDGFEELVLLGTPKTRYIVEMDGDAHSPSLQVWDSTQNLTSSNHRDNMANGGGHGTAVAGILLGGQPGFRKWVGVAPSAELMMIRVIGDENTTLTIEAGLAYANATGADVILTEVGSWTYQYLDGSSLAEEMIDSLVADGIPVISPSGNLGGKDKHALVHTSSGVASQVDFTIPWPGSPGEGQYLTYEPNAVYITVLSRNATDFSVCNFSVVIDRTFWSMPPLTIYLHPGIGYYNFFFEKFNPTAVLNVSSFISTSTRGTQMLGIMINGSLPLTATAPWHQVNITTPQDMTFHCYISDDQSSWTGGCIWKSNVSNNYEITWPSTADGALSVASYRTRILVQSGWGPPDANSDIAGFSSRGPRVDDVYKQCIAAPGGFDVISDFADGSTWQTWFNANNGLPFNKQFGSYRLFSGTSASGPHVAGCAALLLQASSTIGDTVADIITGNARSDGFTGSVPNDIWGAGKLDVEAAVLSLIPQPDVDGPVIGSHDRTPWTPNSTESVLLDVTVTDISGVDTVILSYYNGTAWYNVTMTWTGSSYEGMIPAHPNGTPINYRFYANDTLDNWSISTMFGYTVTDPGPTTTNTSTTTGGPTTTSPPPTEPDYLRLAVILSAVLALILLSVVCARRKVRRID
jgi:hypothetical protein